MENDLFRVLELQHVTPGNLRGFVRVKLRNIRNGTLSDNKLRSEDTVDRATLDEREMQYLYQDGDDFYFMDTDVLRADPHLQRSARRLGELPEAGDDDPGRVLRQEPVGIELPPTVDLRCTDTAPGIKGATASNQIKPATLETGLVVQVPPFVNTGDMIGQHRHRANTCRGPEQQIGLGLATSATSRSSDLTDRTSPNRNQPAWTSSGSANQGWIEVIVGSMFSGKSEELIRRLRRAQIARQRVQIFKPRRRHALRRGPHRLAQRDADPVASRASSRASCSRAVDADTEVVGIDEGQFFDPELPMVCNTLADRGKRVIVAGLDQDYLGKPFEPMPQLLAIAEYITKTHAICMVCGNPANHTQRLVRQRRPRAARRAGHSTKRAAAPASIPTLADSPDEA